MGECCLLVELRRKGFATNGATLSGLVSLYTIKLFFDGLVMVIHEIVKVSL